MVEHGLREANVPTLPGFLDCLSPTLLCHSPCQDRVLGIKLALALNTVLLLMHSEKLLVWMSTYQSSFLAYIRMVHLCSFILWTSERGFRHIPRKILF